jgi:hypothetical protein
MGMSNAANNGANMELKQGDSVVVHGYPGSVERVHAQGVDVRLASGGVCVDPSDVQPGSVWEIMCDCARADMRKARKEGSILICETRRGTVELTYTDRAYEISAEGRCIGRATAKNAVEMIAPLYQVVIEG